MIHPVVCNPVLSPLVGVLDPTAWRAGGSWPSGLLKLYRSTDGLKAALGSIAWDGEPTITADGVAAGHGPNFGSVTRGSGKALAIRVKLTKSSTGITGDEQVLGPLYVRNGYLVAKLDEEEATHAHTWAANDVIDVRINALADGSLSVEDF